MKQLNDAHLITISKLARHDDREISEIAFRGAVRMRTAEAFRDGLEQAGQRSAYLAVDLSELDYLSSAGLSALVSQAQVQEQHGGWLRVVAPSSTVHMILSLAGLLERLPVASSIEDALSSSIRAA